MRNKTTSPATRTRTELVKSAQKRKVTYNLQPDAQTFLSDFKAEIDRAEVSVWAQFYTFEADKAGLPIARALINAAARGLKVHLLIDHSINLLHNDYYLHVPRLNRKLQNSIVNEWRDTKKLIRTMQASGVEVKMTNPLGLFRQRAFRRDHKKLVAIDAETGNGIAYVGGINPSDHNASWNDFMVKMRGDITMFVYKELIRTWNDNSKGGIKNYGDGQFITDVRGEAHIIPHAIKLINKAKRRVIIESAYLWGKNLQTALQRAARRGVEVSVILPLKNNKRVFILTASAIKKLVDAGAHVYKYQDHGGMTHAKALLVDSTAMFGSNNYSEFLSGKINEANIATKNAQLVKQLERFLKNDMAKSLKQD